ncbi:TPA: hypothetical protein DCX16_02985 [bacterium]|nr:hypothetical protein [bacterium]
MKKIKGYWLLSFLLWVIQGWTINIAYIDAQKIFDSHPDAKSAKELLQKEIEKEKLEIKIMEREIMELQKELEKPLSDEAKRKKEIAIKVKLEELQRYEQEAMERIQEKRIKLEQDINSKIYKKIEYLAKERKIDLVIDKDSVIYGIPDLNITDDVIKLIEADKKKDE